MKSQDYLDFELEITSDEDGRHTVAVVHSPAGEARGSFDLPFSNLEMENYILSLQNALLRAGNQRRRVLTPEAETVQKFGRLLFDALFSDEIKSLYAVSRREASRHGAGLRIKLRIGPGELAALPWEFLYDPRRGEYIGLSRKTPIVRYLNLSRAVRPLAVTPPLRILGMVASPSDQEPLDVALEKERLRRALHGLEEQGLVILDWLEGQTWRDLQQALFQNQYHVFHFIGHGYFDEAREEGAVVLADRQGRSHRFSATDLARLLADQTTLRLTVLNSCEGAKAGEYDVFSSTAATLVRRGIPAVIAMQYDITDDAAIQMAETFYQALAGGLPVDAALSEARKSITFALQNSLEWGTPVLFMRASDGRIFDIDYDARLASGRATSHPSQSAATTRSAPVAALPDEESRDNLNMPDSQVTELPQPTLDDGERAKLPTLWRSSLTAYYKPDWQAACQSLQAIVDIDPDYETAATKLAHAKQALRLTKLYEQAQLARADKRWPEEFSLLEELRTIDASYKDVADLFEEAKRLRRVEALYDEAHIMFDADQWQGVVAVFDQISSLSKDFSDPDNLLESAQTRLVAQQQQQTINELLDQVFEQIEAANWPAAAERLDEILNIDPEHADATKLYERVKKELAQASSQDDLRRFELAEVLDSHTGKVRTVNFSPDGRLLVTGSNDKTVRIWNVADYQHLMTLSKFGKQVNSVAFSATNPHALVTGSGGWWGPGKEHWRLQLWNLDSGDAQSILSCGSVQNSIVSVSISSDTGFIAGVDQQRNVNLWNSTDGSSVEGFDPHYALSQLNEFSSVDEIVEEAEEIVEEAEEIDDGGSITEEVAISVYSFAFTSAANQAIITGSGNSRDFCCLYQLDGNVPVRYWVSSEISAPELDPLLNDATPSRIIVASHDTSLLAYRHIDAAAIQILRLWDGSTVSECVLEEPIQNIILSETICALFSPDTSLLAVGYTDGLIRIWNVADGALLQALDGHSQYVIDLAFSPDGSLLASASADSTVRVWRTV